MFNQLLVKMLYDNSRQFTFDINNDGKMFLIIWITNIYIFDKICFTFSVVRETNSPLLPVEYDIPHSSIASFSNFKALELFPSGEIS